MVKTPITDEVSTVSGTISLLSQNTYYDITPYFEIIAGGCWGYIDDITYSGWGGSDPQPSIDHPTIDGHNLVKMFVVYAETGVGGALGMESDHYFLYLYDDDENDFNLEIPYSITTVGQQLYREETCTPSGDRENAPIYAYDVAYTDTWCPLEDGTLSLDFTFGDIHIAQTQTQMEGEWQPYIPAVTGIEIGIQHVTGTTDTAHASISINWSACALDLSQYQHVASSWHIDGDGNTLEVIQDTGVDLSGKHTITISTPYIVDFSDFDVVDRVGTSCTDLIISAPLYASNHFPSSLSWATTPDGATFGASAGDRVYPTLTQLKTISDYVTQPGVTGLEYKTGSDAYDLITSAAFSFALTEESIKATGETYGHNYNDTTLEQRVPGVDATDCYTVARDYDAVTFNHVGSAGIYGPSSEKALTHEDWTVTGSITQPNAAGAFTVSGSGTMTLTLPSNYENRISKITEQVFPDDMPGYPLIAYYHRANKWRDFHGEMDQDGFPWDEPAEAIYCARGFPCLKLSYTAPDDCNLTVTITGKVFTVTNDTHVSDSSRQEDFTYTPNIFTYTYDALLEKSAGTVYFYLTAPNNYAYDPDLEVVETITISGFANGEWVMTEPEWTKDPRSSQTNTIKYFEGIKDQYDHGGLSAVIDNVMQYAAIDITEDNMDHANSIEYTVRPFDYVEGKTSGLDLTIMNTLTDYCNKLNDICDAYTASINTSVWDAMTKDEDDARLTPCYAFNICSASTDSIPLRQAIDGTLNASLRCSSWTIVPGLKYKFICDKVIGGAIHGIGVTGSTLKRDQACDTIYRREVGASTWVEVEGTTTDSAAYWESSNLEVYADHIPTTKRYEYAVGSTNTGYVATREFDFVHGQVAGASKNPHLSVRTEGVYLTFADGNDDAVVYRWSPNTAFDYVGKESSDNYSAPTLAPKSTGVLVMSATDSSGKNKQFKSNDFGETWESVE